MTKQELDAVLQEPALVAVVQTTEWSAEQALVVLRAQRQSGLAVIDHRVGLGTSCGTDIKRASTRQEGL